MKNKNDPGILDNCYQKVFKYSVQLALKFEWQIVAATLVAIGLRIYKTVLKDDEYESLGAVLNTTTTVTKNNSVPALIGGAVSDYKWYKVTGKISDFDETGMAGLVTSDTADSHQWILNIGRSGWAKGDFIHYFCIDPEKINY